MTSSTLPACCSTAEGERRKADAHQTLEAQGELYVLRGRRALLACLLASGEATADDVRDAVELPPGIDPKCFGTVPGLLARAGIIRADGFAKTTRPAAHARALTVWQLVNATAAERWLQDHPDRPDADHDDKAKRQGVLFPLENNPTPTVAAAGAGWEG